MSRLALVLTLVTTLLLRPGAAGAGEQATESRAEIGVEAPRTKVYVGEVLELTLSIRYDSPWFEQHAAALFRQPMSLPVRAVVPAFEPPDGLRAYAEPPWTRGWDGGQTFAVGDQVVQALAADELGSNSGVIVRRILHLSRRFHVTREGVIVLAAPSLEFAWAERFETDLLGARTPVNPQRVTVVGSATELTAFPLPREGRPLDFRGWVGRYGLAMSAQADRTELAAGEALRLTVTIDGEGNHEELPTPTFDELRGFHVLGTLDERTPSGRTLRLDLTPLDATTREIPALSLAFFDPQRGSYQEARSKPIPLTVRGAPPPPAPTPLAPPEPASSGGWVLPAALGLLALVGVGLLVRRRRARVVAAGRPDGRREQVLARLRALAASGSPAAGEALIDVLALYLGTAPAAVVAPDLAARLVRAGLPAALAARMAEAVQASVGARYAGPASAPAPLAPSLIAELEEAVRTRRSL